MEALANAEPLPDDELPPREDAAPGSARKARWSPTCSSCCSRSARARSTSRRGWSRKSEELEVLAAGRAQGLPMLEGWRYEEFGRDALDLVEGRLAFAIREGKLIMTRTALESDNEEPDRRLGAEPARLRNDAD